MKYALFIAEKPTTVSHAENSNWQNFLGYIGQTAEPIGGISRLSEGVYMFGLENGLGAVSEAVHLPSRTLFFDQEPSWIYDKT